METRAHRSFPSGPGLFPVNRPRTFQPRTRRTHSLFQRPRRQIPLRAARRQRTVRAGLWSLCKAVGWLLWKPFTVCRIAGVKVQFHITTLLFPYGTFLWMGWQYDGWSGFRPMALMLAVFGLSLLVHEFAHIFAGRGCGIDTEKMIFLPVGAAALMDDIPRSIKETWISIAGPLSSFALAAICQAGLWAMHHWLYGRHLHHRYYLYDHPCLYETVRMLRFGLSINLSLALFNLLPCYPMDGGRVLRSLIGVTLGKFMKRSRDAAFLLATKISVRYVALPLAAGAIIFTVGWTHLWIHLLTFPLLLAGAELEYRMLRSEIPEPVPEPNYGNVRLVARLHQPTPRLLTRIKQGRTNESTTKSIANQRA